MEHKIETQHDITEAVRKQRRKEHLVISILPGVLGIVSLIIRIIWEKGINESPTIWFITKPPVILTLFAFSALMLLMMYLQTGFKNTEKNESIFSRYQHQTEEFFINNQLDQRISENDKNIISLQEKITQILSVIDKLLGIINERQSNDLIADLKANLRSVTVPELIVCQKDKTANRLEINTFNREIFLQFKESVQRVSLEVAAQGRRGNLNLILGIITTVIGLILLGYFVLNFETLQSAANFTEFTIKFIPRLSVVVFIELFAYFFLRLYRGSLIEIKYFQNELTNIESKAIALRASLNTQNETIIAETIKSLTNTERNRILEKDQTTPDLEKAKIEAKNVTDIAKELGDLLKKYK